MVDLPEPIPSEDLVIFLNTGLLAATDWWAISDGLRFYHSQAANVQVEWLGVAFDHSLTHDVDKGPRAEFEILDNKEAFSNLAPEVLEFWDNVVGRCEYAPIRARLHHMLFLARHGNVGQHLSKAAKAYFEVGNSQWHRLHRVNALDWSLHLSSLIKDVDGQARAVDALLAIADESLNQTEPEPGVSLYALKALALHDPSVAELSDLLDRARAAYPDSRLTTDTINIQKLISHGDHEQISILHRELVQSYLDEADARDGIIKMSLLEDAAQLATLYGVWDLYDTASQKMQSLDFDSLGFVKFESEVVLQGEELAQVRRTIDAHVESITSQHTLIEALHKLIAQTPPSGDLARNEQTAQFLATQFPIQAMVSAVRVRPDGLPSYTATSEEDSLDEKLSSVEMQSMFGPFEVTTRILQELMGRFRPTQAELTQILTRDSIVSSETARTLAKALLAFQRGEYESAVTMAMPKVETIARALLSSQGALTYQVQIGDRRGAIQQLGTLIRDLRPYIDPSWHRFLQTFLVGKFGPNYRNDLLHGYVDDVRSRECALVVLSALFLALTSPAPIQP